MKQRWLLPCSWGMLVLGGFALGVPADAQEELPVSSFLPPDIVECPGEVRLTTERLRDLGTTPVRVVPENPTTGSGLASPGAPAGAETANAVMTTIRQFLTCLNEGDWAAAYGLYAADTIRYLVTDPARDRYGIDPSTADYPFLAQSFGPLHRPYGRLKAHGIVQRTDGQVVATIEVVHGRSHVARTTNVVLVQEEGAWRLVSPLRRLPEAALLAASAEALLPVYLTAPGCTGDHARTGERLRQLGATPATTEPEPPLTANDIDTLPTGNLVDEATADEVHSTIRQYFDCVDWGNWAAAYALYSDDTLRFMITDPTRVFIDVNPTTADYPFLNQARGFTGSGHSRVAVYRTTRRPDGRVGAVIAVEGDPRRVQRGLQYIVLTWEHDRWRLVSPLPAVAFPFGVAPSTTLIP